MAAQRKPTPKPIQNTTPATTRPVAKAPLTQTFQTGFWRDHWLPVLLLLLLPFALYAAAIGFGYVLDDQMVIWQNIYVQDGFKGLGRIFASDSFMGYFKEQKFLLEGGRYRPLSLATFAIEVGVFGKDHPNIGHFINILLYGCNGILLYRVLLGLFPLQEGGKWYMGLPFLAAVFFVLHPLHVEVVANIKGRDEILALMGSLGAMYATLKYFDSENKGWLLASFVSLLFGALAKENAITFLVVIPMTVWFFTKVPLGRVLSASIPLFLTVLVFIIIRYKAMGYMLNHGKSMDDIMNNPFIGMTGGERLATISLTLGWYIKLLFVPHPLTHDYYPYHVPKVGWSDWRAFGSLALYLGMGLWALVNAKKRSIGAYAILYFLITLSIVSNLFVGVGTFMNERFVYMPSLSYCLLLAWFLARCLPDWLQEKADRPYLLGTGLVLIVAGLFAYRIWTRVPDWENAMTLNESSVRNSEGSCRSHCFYATALYQEKFQKAKTKEEKKPYVDLMEYHINRAIEINPNYVSAMTMKAAIAAARFEQDNQLDKLFHEFSILVEKIPNNPSFRQYLGDYMKYLKGSSPNKYTSFCHQTGYEYYWKQRKDSKSALEFLNYGLSIQTEDERILQDLIEVYHALGDKTKEAEMQQRLVASKKLIMG